MALQILVDFQLPSSKLHWPHWLELIRVQHLQVHHFPTPLSDDESVSEDDRPLIIISPHMKTGYLPVLWSRGTKLVGLSSGKDILFKYIFLHA